MIFQKDRQYRIEVDVGSTKVIIENLHVTFTVSKSSDNKKNPNKANVKIYNLSLEKQRLFETPYTKVTLFAGYQGIGVLRLFSGEATIVGTEKNGADTVTEIQLDTLFTEINHKRVSKTVREGVTLRQVIESLVKEMPSVNRVVFSGTNITKGFVDGYPLVGTPYEILNEISEAFELEWQIDNDILYIEDRGTSYMLDKNKAFLISELTGMIERPYFDNVAKGRSKKDKVKKARKGLRVKILLNPAMIAGGLVKLEYGDLSGVYKIESLRHNGDFYGSAWETDLVLATEKQ